MTADGWDIKDSFKQRRLEKLTYNKFIPLIHVEENSKQKSKNYLILRRDKHTTYIHCQLSQFCLGNKCQSTVRKYGFLMVRWKANARDRINEIFMCVIAREGSFDGLAVLMLSATVADGETNLDR